MCDLKSVRPDMSIDHRYIYCFGYKTACLISVCQRDKVFLASLTRVQDVAAHIFMNLMKFILLVIELCTKCLH